MEVWSKSALLLGIPEDKLLPTDRFDKELATLGLPFYHWADDLEDYILCTHREAGVPVGDLPKTLGECTILLAKLKERKRI